MRKILSLFLAITLLICLVNHASAHDFPDADRLGSIELILSYDGKVVSGGTLTAIRVGAIEEDNGDYYFRSLIDDTVFSASEIQSSKTAYEIAGTVEDYTLETTEKTVPNNGILKFDGLKTGLYLIIQEEPSPGYSELAPFLVSLPYMEDGEYRYDVTAKIKTELHKEPETTSPGTEPTSPDKLPQTGQLTWPIPIMATVGVVLLLSGWILCFYGRRKDDYEV